MGRKLVYIAAVLLSWLVVPAQVFAFNQQLTVYATVPPMRAVYLNGVGAVIRVAGNTSENVEPVVYDASNNEVPMTPDIHNQYDNFLAAHGNKLQASKIYDVNPVSVNNQSDSQTISITSQSSSLSLSLSP